jgi:hypothetical protein
VGGSDCMSRVLARGGAVAFVLVGVGVGPDLEQRADEALCFAVGLWPVGPGLADRDLVAVARLAPAALEAAAVIGDHALDRDPVPAVEADHSSSKAVAEAAVSSG